MEKATDEAIAQWAARHDLKLSATDARAAFEDAQTLTTGNMSELLDFEPNEKHTVPDMANVGHSLMQAIALHRPEYAWNTSPAEIVGVLVNEIEEMSQPTWWCDEDEGGAETPHEYAASAEGFLDVGEEFVLHSWRRLDGPITFRIALDRDGKRYAEQVNP